MDKFEYITRLLTHNTGRVGNTAYRILAYMVLHMDDEKQRYDGGGRAVVRALNTAEHLVILNIKMLLKSGHLEFLGYVNEPGTNKNTKSYYLPLDPTRPLIAPYKMHLIEPEDDEPEDGDTEW